MVEVVEAVDSVDSREEVASQADLEEAAGEAVSLEAVAGVEEVAVVSVAHEYQSICTISQLRATISLQPQATSPFETSHSTLPISRFDSFDLCSHFFESFRTFRLARNSLQRIVTFAKPRTT